MQFLLKNEYQEKGQISYSEALEPGGNWILLYYKEEESTTETGAAQIRSSCEPKGAIYGNQKIKLVSNTIHYGIHKTLEPLLFFIFYRI